MESGSFSITSLKTEQQSHLFHTQYNCIINKRNDTATIANCSSLVQILVQRNGMATIEALV